MTTLAGLYGPPQPHPDPFAEALKAYPRLGGLGVNAVTTPMPGDYRKLEFWQPDETGDQQYPRPQGLPVGRPGVQIISPDTTSSDVAGDIVSHYMVNQDPVMQSLYKQFVGAFDNPKQASRLQEDYAWSKANEGEQRPFDEWRAITRMPDYLRGQMFNQWPQKSWPEMYTPQESDLVKLMSGYLGSTPAPRGGPQ